VILEVEYLEMIEDPDFKKTKSQLTDELKKEYAIAGEKYRKMKQAFKKIDKALDAWKV